MNDLFGFLMEPTAELVKETAKESISQFDNWNEAFGLSAEPQTIITKEQKIPDAVIEESSSATMVQQAAWGNDDSNINIDEEESEDNDIKESLEDE